MSKTTIPRRLLGHVDLRVARDDVVILLASQLDRLDATRADVETDDALPLLQHGRSLKVDPVHSRPAIGRRHRRN